MHKLKGKDYISLRDYSKEDIDTILEVAFELKRKVYVGETHRLLEGKELGMLFFNPSTRTRISFERAMSQLGGHAQFYAPEHLHVFFRESWVDTAEVMARYLDAIMIRLYRIPDQELKYGEAHNILGTMADHSSVPVINASDDQEHPCQVMADLQTLIEKFGADYRRRKVALVWCPHPRALSPGIPHSLAIAGAKLGMNLTYAYPEGFNPDPEYIEEGKRLARKSGGSLEITNNISEATKNADVIYNKSWRLIHKTVDEYLEARKALLDWRLTKKHFENANPDAIFMNAMPMAREIDATNEIIDAPNSVIYDQAENRLHAQKAIMSLIM